jgi:hypothetical protein
MVKHLTRAESLERRERAVLIEKAMNEMGLTFESLAAEFLMTVASLRNVINGATESPRTRQRLTNRLDVQIWPGVEPRTSEGCAAARALMQEAISSGQQLLAGLGPDAEPEQVESVLRELDALASEELGKAIRLYYPPLEVVAQLCRTFPGPILDRLVGIRRDPQNPNRIYLGAPEI